MFELQLYNPASGHYVRNVTGEKPSDLADLGRLVSNGDGFRVVSLQRDNSKQWYRKILPLKAPKAPRRSKPLAPSRSDYELEKIAADFYAKREAKSNKPVAVYLWKHRKGAPLFSFNLRRRLGWNNPRFNFIELDPDEPGCAFGPDAVETV